MHTPATLDRLLLKPAEAARLLAISQRTLWSLTREGTIPCVRLGRNVRYIVSDIQGAVDSLRQAADPSLR